MTHLDLFSGIGGFALAAQTVWGEDYHCVGFCEIDSFCQQALRKNFKGVTIYGDIRGLTAERLAADAAGGGCGLGVAENERTASREVNPSGNEASVHIDLLTGGFPCQPFSTAGKRRGTEDDRVLWPEMFRVIRETKPRWIIGENVAGIIEMALGQVCSELESLDYEVQCFVIPACAVNAPHRRDRVWIVAHAADTNGGRNAQPRIQHPDIPSESGRCPSPDTTGDRWLGRGQGAKAEEGLQPRPEPARELESRLEGYDCPSPNPDRAGSGASPSGTDGERQETGEERQQPQHERGGQGCPPSDPLCDASRGAHGSEGGSGVGGRTEQNVGEWDEVGSNPPDDRGEPTANAEGEGLEGRERDGRGQADARSGQGDRVFPDWGRDWREVAFESCLYRVDDGLPGGMVGLSKGIKGGYRTVPGGEEGQILISESKWRQNALKAYGNAIVPQVAMEIMRGIKEVDAAEIADALTLAA